MTNYASPIPGRFNARGTRRNSERRHVRQNGNNAIDARLTASLTMSDRNASFHAIFHAERRLKNRASRIQYQILTALEPELPDPDLPLLARDRDKVLSRWKQARILLAWMFDLSSRSLAPEWTDLDLAHRAHSVCGHCGCNRVA